MNYFIAFVCCSSDKENVSEEEKQDHEGTEHEGKEDGAHDQHEDHEDDEVMFSLIGVFLMAHLHCRTQIRIPNQMAALYYTEHFTKHGLGLGSLLPIFV